MLSNVYHHTLQCAIDPGTNDLVRTASLEGEKSLSTLPSALTGWSGTDPDESSRGLNMVARREVIGRKV